MPKKENSIKIEKVPLLKTPLDAKDSDNEIELKHVAPPSAPPSAPSSMPVKEKKKINISDEERERRRQRMLQNREVKMQNAELRKHQQQEFLKAKEAEMNKKIMKEAEKLRKRQEREMLQRMMYSEVNKTSRLDDEYEEEEYEEMPIPKSKPRPKPQPTPRPKPPSVQQPQPVYQQPVVSEYNSESSAKPRGLPVYQAPAFRWV